MALLARSRCYWQASRAAQEGIGQTTQTEEVIERADQIGAVGSLDRSFEVGPIGRD
jgi:hypothetical protein